MTCDQCWLLTARDQAICQFSCEALTPSADLWPVARAEQSDAQGRITVSLAHAVIMAR
jgi:hypothetical protein